MTPRLGRTRLYVCPRSRLLDSDSAADLSYLFHRTMPISSAGWTSRIVQSHPNPPSTRRFKIGVANCSPVLGMSPSSDNDPNLLNQKMCIQTRSLSSIRPHLTNH